MGRDDMVGVAMARSLTETSKVVVETNIGKPVDDEHWHWPLAHRVREDQTIYAYTRTAELAQLVADAVNEKG